MSLQTISFLLYVASFIVLVYVIYEVRRTNKFSVEAAIGVIAIFVAILLALNLPQPAQLKDISGASYGTGKVETPDGIFDTTMTITLTDDCEEGKVCGQSFFPDISCSLSLEYLGEKDGRFYFNEQKISTGCGSAFETYLEPIGINKIKYYAKGDWGETNIILERR